MSIPQVSGCFPLAPFSSMPAARPVGEVNQAVAIVNLDLQHPQKLKSEDAGDLGARALADIGQIEAHDIQVLLREPAKLKRCFVSTVNVGHSPADSLDMHVGVGSDLGDLASRPRGKEVGPSACIDQKQHWLRVVDLGSDQECMAKVEDRSPAFHLWSDV